MSYWLGRLWAVFVFPLFIWGGGLAWDYNPQGDYYMERARLVLAALLGLQVWYLKQWPVTRGSGLTIGLAKGFHNGTFVALVMVLTFSPRFDVEPLAVLFVFSVICFGWMSSSSREVTQNAFTIIDLHPKAVLWTAFGTSLLIIVILIGSAQPYLATFFGICGLYVVPFPQKNARSRLDENARGVLWAIGAGLCITLF